MITLTLVCGFLLASCLAAAGLIASSQNVADDARAMAGLATGSETVR